MRFKAFAVAALAWSLCACATIAAPPPIAAPECSGGVCIYRVHHSEARVLCAAFFGQPAENCWNPDIKVAVESAPEGIGSDICSLSADEAACRSALFGEDLFGRQP